MDLKQRLTEDMKTAMRSADKPRLGVIRLVLAAIKQREVDERIELDDAEVLAVLEKMRKQRQDSESQFREAGRADLADQEHFEIGVIQAYLPEPMGKAELDTAIEAAVAETGAESMRDMGKLMGLLKARLAGRVDMSELSAKIKSRLSS